MSFVNAAVIVGGAALAGGYLSSEAAKSAANTQANAANNATNTQQGMFNLTNEQQAPWRQAGENSLGDIASMQPYFQHQFNAGDLNANLAPNYKFMLDQGLGATKNAANAQTGLLSGNTLKGVADYATNYAGNAYQNAFSNYTANQNNIFNRLSTIAGMGSASAIASGNQGVTTGGNIGSSQIAAGQAAGSGIVGSANALTGGLNNAASWYALPKFMNAGGGSGGGTAASMPEDYMANIG